MVRSSEMYTTSAKSILNSVRLRNARGIAYCAFSSASGRAAASFSTAVRSALHGCVVAVADSGVFHFAEHVVAVLGGESLHDLDAAAVAVHVAEAADVHEDVEAELLAGAERAQHFVVLAAMTQAQIDDLAPATFARDLHGLPNLPVGMMAVLVNQRGREFDFERLFIEQIDDGLGWRYWLRCSIISRAACRNSRRVSISYGIRIGILDQSGSHAHFAQQFLLGSRAEFRTDSLRICSTSSRSESSFTLYAGASGGLLQRFAQIANFPMGVREQMRNLSFERARVDDFPSEVLVASGSR